MKIVKDMKWLCKIKYLGIINGIQPYGWVPFVMAKNAHIKNDRKLNIFFKIRKRS